MSSIKLSVKPAHERNLIFQELPNCFALNPSGVKFRDDGEPKRKQNESQRTKSNFVVNRWVYA